MIPADQIAAMLAEPRDGDRWDADDVRRAFEAGAAANEADAALGRLVRARFAACGAARVTAVRVLAAEVAGVAGGA